MATGMEFCLLGPITVRCDGAVVPVRPGKQRAVLASLLLKAGQVVPLDDLEETLWLSGAPPSARVTTQNYVMRLRKALSVTSRALISTQPGGYLISVDADELDVSRFEAMLGAAHAAARDGAWDTASRQARAALSLWRGEPLAGVGSEVLAQREVPRLAELRLQALEARICADLYLGRYVEVIADLQGLATAHPLREQLHALLMLALYRDSRQCEALAAYQRARRVLIRELGVEPGAQLRGLHQQILANDPTLITAPATAAAVAVDGLTSRNGELADRRAGKGSEVVPRQLPACPPGFAGRTVELVALSELLAERAVSPGTVVISAIGGMAGVGKTALAVNWAHQVAGQFPDGQLYVNLRGFGPSAKPVEPPAAIRGFLDALGFAAERIPASPEAQAGLYRSLLAGKRMLLVLDNARDEDQVRPLLPASSGCLVVVTSRTRLTGLVAADGARMVNLDVLTEAEAHEVLARRLGTERTSAEPHAVSELISLCGRLPLALAITAARGAACPGFPLAALAAELREGQQLAALGTGEAATSMRAVFSWSYQHLDAPAARMFRLLALHPGHDITPPAAARLADLARGQAHDLLRDLTRAHLLTEPAPGRYTFHDLLRAYAASQTAGTDSQDDRNAALTRLFDYHLAAVSASMDTLAPAEHDRRSKVSEPAMDSPLADTPEAARSWLDAERANLVAIVGHAATRGWLAHSTRMAAILFRYLDNGGHCSDAMTVHSHALDAARQAGDRAAQADALRSRSAVDFRQGRYQPAARQLQQALTIYRELGDRYGQARTLGNLGLVLRQQGSFPEAITHHRQALALSQVVGDKFGQALALHGLGMALCRQGLYRQAADHHQQALALFRDVGEPRSEAEALTSLGAALCGQKRYQQAVGYHRQARALFHDLGNRPSEADALNGTGEALAALGRIEEAQVQHRNALTLAREVRDLYQEARAHHGLATAYQLAGDRDHAHYHWERALARYRDIGVPEADQVRATLDSLAGAAH